MINPFIKHISIEIDRNSDNSAYLVTEINKHEHGFREIQFIYKDHEYSQMLKDYETQLKSGVAHLTRDNNVN